MNGSLVREIKNATQEENSSNNYKNMFALVTVNMEEIVNKWPLAWMVEL